MNIVPLYHFCCTTIFLYYAGILAQGVVFNFHTKVQNWPLKSEHFLAHNVKYRGADIQPGVL